MTGENLLSWKIARLEGLKSLGKFAFVILRLHPEVCTAGQAGGYLHCGLDQIKKAQKYVCEKRPNASSATEVRKAQLRNASDRQLAQDAHPTEGAISRCKEFIFLIYI